MTGQWTIRGGLRRPREVAPPPPPSDTRLFTGKKRGSETGRDYFGARYYRANRGRFTTVDPAMTLSENLVDPQRWNRYTYVRNNPLRYVDPDGRQIYMPMPSFLSKEALERNASIRAAILTVAAAGPNGDVAAVVLDALLLSTVLPATTSERDAAIVGSVFALAAPLEIPVGAKLGVAGGPGAGKAFRAWVKDAVREEGPACVFCGEPTTLTPGPRQSNIDHAVPKSRLGNDTIENAQNTCRTCNLKKGNKTTSEFWEWLFGKSESQK
jgi:RHS repeat-associated protein